MRPSRVPLSILVQATILVALADASAAAQDNAARPPLEADLIVSNAQIYTPSGWATDMAIKDGVILAVGSPDDALEHKGSKTEMMDLRGAPVLPGLHDMHVHALFAGQNQLQCMFPQGSNLRTLRAAIRACAGKLEKGAWIVGGQWDTASVGQTPHRKLLDEAAPDNPVALTDISLHGLWVNSRALELAGVDASTTAPAGGVVERDRDGSPTGVFWESATVLVRRVIPPFTAQQNADALAWSTHTMLSHGITSFTDALVDQSSLEAYAALADRGALKQRVRGCLTWGRSVLSTGDDADHVVLRNLYARERFSPTCIKIVLDGVPTAAHTGAMVQPYADAADPADEHAKGILMIPAATLNDAVTQFDAQGFTVKMHAAGDAAVRAGLDAIAAARKANGFGGQPHEISHASFVQPDDVGRARQLGATFEFSPYIWFPNPIIPDILKAIGSERMQRFTPVKDLIDAGALAVAGSDWSVVPSVNPWLAIETLVTRQPPGGGEELAASQKISLAQALELFTGNAARQMRDRTQVGTLEPGMLADFIVLDRNPFDTPVTQIHQTLVKMTVIDGEVVYRAAADTSGGR